MLFRSLKLLFQPFAQAADTAGSFGGTGLGLSICRRLAELMGGSVQIESELGKGTTTSLTLPFPIADASELPETSGERARESGGTTIGKRRAAPTATQARADATLVLLADDHPINRIVLIRQLNTLGYAVEAAEDGREALDKWKSGDYGLVITDCNMPEMDGYELARTIRGDRKSVV